VGLYYYHYYSRVVQIMFKMDINGNGVLVENVQLNKAMGLRSDTYTFNKFRYACILSGCDYLPSLPGIGLAKATKVFQLSRQTDLATVTEYYYYGYYYNYSQPAGHWTSQSAPTELTN